MAKPRKQSESRHEADESAVIVPQEQPEAQYHAETAVVTPSETPAARPVEVCGINGCPTRYRDPALMKRHRERQHGIGGQNLNKPLPRNANIKLA